MSCEKDTRIESLFLFFLSIYLFDDFQFQEECVVLKLREDQGINSQKILLHWLLNIPNQNIDSEFFFLGFRDEESLIEIKCNSHPQIFAKLQDFLKKMLSVENQTQL